MPSRPAGGQVASPGRDRAEDEDLVLRFGPDDGKGPRLFIASPAGEATTLLRFSFSKTELLRLALSPFSWQPRPAGPEDAPVSVVRPAVPGRLGHQLFQALFRGRSRKLFDDSRAAVQARGRGLRLRLQIDLQDREQRRLFSLPWELVRPAGERHLLLRREIQILRHLVLPQPIDHRPRVRELRVLVVMAAPQDQPPLGLEKEWQALETVWRDHPTVRLVPLENPTLDQLSSVLEGGEYHVLHFMGHGGFDVEQKKWVLCFRDELGETEYVPAQRLAEQLADFRQTLRLVVLNACQTARVLEPSSGEAAQGIGIATAMMSEGLTSVVGLQSAISDRAAIELTQGLYHRLAAGDPLERAVAAARRRLRRLEWTGAGKPFEWAAPVLFLRSVESRLFEVDAENAGHPEPSSWHPSKLGLAALGVGGLGAVLLAGLGSLWIFTSPPLRVASMIALATAGGLAWLTRRLWASYGSRYLTGDLSQAIAARRWLLALLFVLPLLAVAGWVSAGRAKVDALSCGPLGLPRPGHQRIALVPFDVPEPGGSRQESLWASETTDRLADALRQAEGFEVLTWDDGPPASLGARCVDATLRGQVRQDDGVRLRAELSKSARPTAVLEQTGAEDDQGSIEHLQRALVKKVLAELGLGLGVGERLLGTLPTHDPKAEQLNRLGVLAFLEGELYEAENRLHGALALDSGYPSAHNNLGRVLASRQPPELSRAIVHFRRASELEPERALYPFNLGLALEREATALPLGAAARRARLVEAVVAYERAIACNPAMVRAYNNLGFTWLELGELEKAEARLVQGRNLATDKGLLPFFEKNLGRLALARGEPRRAIEHLERALASRPDFPEALFFLARAQEALTQRREIEPGITCRTLRRYVAVAANDPDTSRLQHAKMILKSLDCGG